MACEVETGKPPFVIMKTEKPADRAVIKAPGNAEIAPSFPKVSVVPAPENKAPNKTQIAVSYTHLTLPTTPYV